MSDSHINSDPILDDLRKKVFDTYNAYDAMHTAMSGKRRDLEEKARADINRQMGEDPAFKSINALWEAKIAAENALHKAESETDVRNASAKLPYPEGTILAEWNAPGYWAGRKEMTLTGKRAVIQIFREGGEYPRNRRYGRPQPGSIILRELKKNGVRGVKVSQWSDHLPKAYWLQEGQEPELNKQLKEKK